MTQKLMNSSLKEFVTAGGVRIVVISCNEERYAQFAKHWDDKNGCRNFLLKKLPAVKPTRIPDALKQMSTRSYGPELGCLLSHRLALSYAEMCEAPMVWIMEDDCRLRRFSSYFELLQQVIEDWDRYPDLDVVHLDGWWHDAGVPMFSFDSKTKESPIHLQGPPVPGVPRVYPRVSGRLWCTHSYLVHCRAYKRLIAQIDDNLFDVFKWDVLLYNDEAPHGVMIPAPCIQCAGYSDIAQRELPEKI